LNLSVNADPICSSAMHVDAAPLLRQIAKDIGMTMEEFLGYR
jgi:hypothetical protein